MSQSGKPLCECLDQPRTTSPLRLARLRAWWKFRDLGTVSSGARYCSMVLIAKFALPGWMASMSAFVANGLVAIVDKICHGILVALPGEWRFDLGDNRDVVLRRATLAQDFA